MSISHNDGERSARREAEHEAKKSRAIALIEEIEAMDDKMERIRLGSVVELLFEDEEKPESYMMINEYSDNIKSNEAVGDYTRLSIGSAVGAKVYGRKAGETVFYETPSKNELSVGIVSIK